MKLQYVEIDSFLGIQSARFNCDDVTLFVGKSRSGKTSAINAIYAALKSRGFGPECICDDADRWRVLLKFDKATVETIVRRSGNKSVKVDGLGLGSPQAKLDAFFPDLIDPWRLANDDPAERRRKVLAAMPATVTAEDAKRWTGEDWKPEEGKHGVDVIDELHDHYYAQRTKANKAVDDAEAALKLANDEAERLHALDKLPKGTVVPVPVEEDKPLREAEAHKQTLEQRRQQAEDMAKRTEGTREKIAKLLAAAGAKRGEAPEAVTEDELRRLDEACAAADAEVTRIETLLDQARSAADAACLARNVAANRAQAHARCIATANEWEAQAASLEATLAEAAIQAPTADELAAADAAIAQARTHADLVRGARAAHDATVKVAVLTEDLEAAKVEAKRLDDIVKRLDNDAPAELAKRANMPAGLSFVDGDIALDGHQFKLLSESEKAELCVEAVKRIAPDAGFLRIDKLEGMDPDLREDFIRKAKAGGWQILGTVVERGEMRIVTVDADDEEEVVRAEPWSH